MSKIRKGPAVGRRAESGATPGPKGEAKRTRQPGGSAAPDFSDASENSAFHRSPVLSGVPPVTRALRVEIAKPLNMEWRELEDLLRLYRSVMHRLYNAAIFGVATEEAWGEKVFRLPGNAASSGGRAYQMIKRELEELREWGARQKGEGLATRYPRLNLSGGTMSAIGREAMARYTKWQKSKGSESLPSYRKGAPIPVRAQEYSISESNGRVTLSFTIEGSGGRGRCDVALCASRGSHWSRLLDMARGAPELKLGQLKIQLDERSRKWMVLISFSHPAPEAPELDQERVLVVHRGQHNLLTAISSTGHFRVIARGNKYMAQRKALAARGTAAKAITSAERGGGASGHGRERRFATYDAIQDKIARVNTTLCQQLGAAVVRLAHEWGCGRVVIEDYGGIEADEQRGVRRFVERFPNYQLKESIRWALRKDGLGLDEVDCAYVSSECPRCGSTDERQHNARTNVFHCVVCSYERPADFVASLHMLRRSGADMAVWDERFARERSLVASASVARDGNSGDQPLVVEPGKAQKGGARKPARKCSKPSSPRRVGSRS